MSGLKFGKQGVDTAGMDSTKFLTSLQAALPTVTTTEGYLGWPLAKSSATRTLAVLLVTGPTAGRCVDLSYDEVTLSADFVRAVPRR